MWALERKRTAFIRGLRDWDRGEAKAICKLKRREGKTKQTVTLMQLDRDEAKAICQCKKRGEEYRTHNHMHATLNRHPTYNSQLTFLHPSTNKSKCWNSCGKEITGGWLGTRNDMHINLNVHPLCKPMQSKIGTHAVKNEWDRGEAKAIWKHKKGEGNTKQTVTVMQ